MKATKQLTSSIIAAAVALLLATPAMAETADNVSINHPEDTGNTQITAGVNQSYTLVIPEDIVMNDLEAGGDSDLRSKPIEVSAKSVVLEPDMQLNVSISGETNASGDLILTNQQNSAVQLPYEVFKTANNESTAVSNHGLFATFVTSTKAQAQSGSIVVADPTMGAGTYQGTLTFVCSVEQQASTNE